jgi:signal transduction histidine kinase/ligand-binding sensor domain-containing protein
VILGWRSHAFALNPTLDITQYAHTSWKITEGFSKGRIWSIAQTPEGYLWLGTEFGLMRFDGVRAVPWAPPSGDHLPSPDIRSLRVSRDGRLWIGTYRGLVAWDGVKLTRYPEFDGRIIEALDEDGEGTLWVVAGWTLSAAKLCRVLSGKTACYGEDGGAGAGVTTVYADSKGALWAGAMTGVWRWNPGPPKFYPIAGPAQRTYALLESEDGGLLVARRGGISKLMNGGYEPYPSPGGPQFPPFRLLRDRGGSLWVGALVDHGLMHIHRGRTDVFTRFDGLSGDTPSSVFEDREGNIWVATENGLDRFRDFAIPTMSVEQGLSSRGVSSVLAARDGSVWMATSDGVNRWKNGVITIYRRGGRDWTRGGSAAGGFMARPAPGATRRVQEIFGIELPDKEVESLFEDARGNIWVAATRGVAVFASGRFHRVPDIQPGNLLSFAGDSAGNVFISGDDALLHLYRERLIERIPWATFGKKEPALALLYDGMHGGLWLGFREGGVALFEEGRLRASYTAAQGLGDGVVQSLYSDAAGALWAATEGGLSRIQDGRIATLTTRNGLPCNSIHWLMEGVDQSVWLYTACGLVRIARTALDAWGTHPQQTIQPRTLDGFDGVGIHPLIISGYSPIVTKDTDGTLWFVASDGVSILDPRHLSANTLQPPVRIEKIAADGRSYAPGGGLRLPPRVRDLSIDYTALSLVAPEKVRFRYMLEGQDADWKEVVNDRRVQYSNLAPGAYRFRVTASNNSGVWNETGASLDFSIAPTYYQTRWFEALMVVSALALLWVAYELRMRQVARQFNRMLDARVNERTRIARDLHDTMLQSFQGALLRFQSVATVITTRPDEASKRLEQALDQAETAVTEGRNAVHGLRASATTLNDLGKAIAAFGAELTGDPTLVNAPAIAVEIDGASRMLNPLVRDEAYRIASEALRNAIRHAAARYITVTIHYEPRQLRLTVIDDGKGIAAETLERQQVAGHFGLPGMRERAAVVKGQLEVRSAPGAGTEIELRVPAAIAYGGRPSWWSRVFSSKVRAHVEQDAS